MLIYWLLFAYFAFGASFEKPRSVTGTVVNPMFRLGCVLIALLVGLRFHVGADWVPYEYMFADARGSDLSSVPSNSDPGYFLVNVFVQWLGGKLWLSNLICGTIFAWGLMRFCEAQDRPWLAAVVAIPYLVIVVAMGYTRQSVAIAIVMAGLASYFRNGSALRFVAYVIVAATFHKTAVVALPLIAMANERARWITLPVVTIASYLLYDYFLAGATDKLVSNYIDAHYQSEGAGIRVAMSVVPAALFVLRSKKIGFPERERLVWRNVSLVVFGLLIVLLMSLSSTAVDRMALYVIPLQLAVLSRPTSAMVTGGLGAAVVILYSAMVQFTWLTFAHHALYWVPYQFWPL